ncbi:hypothetical protein GGI04_004814 [Coemansia thaxteri]|nr:hypothetical protein GGI04_004814 [Coemansia thaxteri]
MGLNNTATNVIKNATGRLRPDFIDRCRPSITDNPKLRLVNYTVCTQTDLDYLHEGMRSFPSGHASLAFCGLMFTSLYLASHLRYNDQRGHAYKTIVFYLPLFCAVLIAISRTADYHHHWQDVLAGSLMGTFIGWFGYRTYFPSAFDPTLPTDRPYPSRIPKPENFEDIGTKHGKVVPVDDDPLQMGTIVVIGQDVRAYGAGLLSSLGELEYALTEKPEKRSFDPSLTAVQKYPITQFQPVYFVADSFRDAASKLHEFTSTMKRPFKVRYNPHTQSVEVLGSKDKVQHFARSIRNDMQLLASALE